MERLFWTKKPNEPMPCLACLKNTPYNRINPSVSRLYRLPKTHKGENLITRPLVSCIDSFTHKLQQFWINRQKCILLFSLNNCLFPQPNALGMECPLNHLFVDLLFLTLDKTMLNDFEIILNGSKASENVFPNFKIQVATPWCHIQAVEKCSNSSVMDYFVTQAVWFGAFPCKYKTFRLTSLLCSFFQNLFMQFPDLQV